MSELSEYLAFAASHPDYFRNPKGGRFTLLLDEDDIHCAQETQERRLDAAGKPTSWATVGIVYRDDYLWILRDAVRYADGSLGTYIREVSPSGHTGVVIFPVRGEDVLLVRHFRHATRTWHLEVPRGFGDGDDTAEDARRELSEEIAATATRLVSMGEIYPDSGIMSERVALFYATVQSFGRPEKMEGIAEVVPTSLTALEEMIARGDLTDSFTLCAYARAKASKLI